MVTIRSGNLGGMIAQAQTFRRHGSRAHGQRGSVVWASAILGLMTLVFWPSCSAEIKSTIPKKVSYHVTAKQNYDKGTKALKGKSYEEATKYFRFVQSRFPHSRFSALAELRMADVHRDSEKFVAAIDAYRTFIKERPTHPEVESGYVAYNIGYCYWRLTPSDFFILPPALEKDQTSAEAAMLAFQTFLKQFPDSKYRTQAQHFYKRALGQLAAHEMYVARFYLGRNKPKGAIFRLEYLIKRYPDAGVQPEVMFLLGRTYLGLKQPKRAREVFRSLVEKHPSDHNARKAERYLAFIAREHGLK